MQLERARIRNFRSLRDVEVVFGAHTALIGGNGAGKSSILKAIEKFYSTTKNCDADDFFGRDQGQPIEIELTFHQLSEQEAAAFEDRVRDGRLVVTRIFDGGPSSGRYHGVVPQIPDFVAVRAHSAATPKRAAYNALRENNPLYADLPTAGSAAAVDQAMLTWEAEHPDQLVLLPDDGQFFGFQNNSRGKLQQHTSFVFIPAVRDASADAADGKTSVIGKLLELLVRSQILQRPDVQAFKAQMTEAYQALVSAENMPELGALAGTLTADLRGLYQDAEVSLAWREVGEMPVPLPMADVFLKDEGFGGPVDRWTGKVTASSVPSSLHFSSILRELPCRRATRHPLIVTLTAVMTRPLRLRLRSWRRHRRLSSQLKNPNCISIRPNSGTSRKCCGA